MLLLGIDLGTSSIKVSVVDSQTQNCIASAQYPENEVDIIALQPGWAEQNPDQWWDNTQKAILKCHATNKYNPKEIKAIGIDYQMHGLVLVDKQHNSLRNSIIWCDSRAVSIGNLAFETIGTEKCLSHLLNSPGNFTASKLAWVKKNEPQVYEKIHKVMLPGDFIAMKLTGEIATTVTALSEGVFWDFRNNTISQDICNYYGFEPSIFPTINPLFGSHGQLKNEISEALKLEKSIAVTYKSGDQPNNALSLNVFNPGEVAATAGTSGVIYAVSNTLGYDKQSRINSFAHVNHQENNVRVGNLLCINGVGIFNRWIKNIVGADVSYDNLNTEASKIAIGAQGLKALPFGNGAERMLNNNIVGSHFNHVDFNLHTRAHMVRAVQEGIAFSFRYGLDIMKENGILPKVIRAGNANMFLSNVFTASFAGATATTVELYNADGSVGAAIGAGLGALVFTNEQEAFKNTKVMTTIEPINIEIYEEIYQEWKELLEKQIKMK